MLTLLRIITTLSGSDSCSLALAAGASGGGSRNARRPIGWHRPQHPDRRLGRVFLGRGALLAIGALRKQAALVVGACLVGLVIPGRILSATMHGGAWTPDEILGECVILGLGLLTAAVISRNKASSPFG